MASRAPEAPRAPSDDALVARLRRAEGQLRGVQRMIGEGAECRDVLTQLAAVKAAVDQVGLHLIGDRLRACVAGDGPSCQADFEQAMQTLLRYGSLGK